MMGSPGCTIIKLSSNHYIIVLHLHQLKPSTRKLLYLFFQMPRLVLLSLVATKSNIQFARCLHFRNYLSMQRTRSRVSKWVCVLFQEKTLRENIEKRRLDVTYSFPTQSSFCQVASLLSPSYKLMTYMEHLYSFWKSECMRGRHRLLSLLARFVLHHRLLQHVLTGI